MNRHFKGSSGIAEDCDCGRHGYRYRRFDDNGETVGRTWERRRCSDLEAHALVIEIRVRLEGMRSRRCVAKIGFCYVVVRLLYVRTREVRFGRRLGGVIAIQGIEGVGAIRMSGSECK